MTYPTQLVMNAVFLVGMASVGVLISPWATLAMFVSYLLGALVRDLDYWTVKK